MGLCFNRSNVSWSYGEFSKFRKKLAHEIGIFLPKMEGFGGTDSWDKVDDDIKYFLNHSDCDGNLSPEKCGMIAPRLKELSNRLDGYDKISGIELADDMHCCFVQGKKLEFQ